MVTTAFGPQGPNYTTVRTPADPKASAGADTWFKNCSAAGAKDGTFATADFFNVTIANLRYLVRTSGVTLDDATDTMIYEAVLAMILAHSGGGDTPTTGTVPFGNPTVYVRTDGDDSHDGSANDAAHALRTIQGALTYAQNKWSLGGKKLFIQLGNPGTYTGFVEVEAPQTGVTITGDINNQSAYVINEPATDFSSQQIVSVTGAVSLDLVGLTVTGSRTDSYYICANVGAYIRLDHVSVIAGVTTPGLALAAGGGVISINGPVNISGNFGAALSASGGGLISISINTTLTLVGTPAFSVATVYCYANGSVIVGGTIAGAATGQRYLIYLNGTALTNGTIPGSTAGVLATGGQIT